MPAQPTSRRALLKEAAVLTAIPAAALGEPIAPETPILRLFREWEALLEETEAAYQAVKGQGMEAEDAVYEAYAPERRRIEEALIAEPATDLRDLAVKVLVLSGEGNWALPKETVLECAALVGRDPGKMPRCLFEQEACSLVRTHKPYGPEAGRGSPAAGWTRNRSSVF